MSKANDTLGEITVQLNTLAAMAREGEGLQGRLERLAALWEREAEGQETDDDRTMHAHAGALRDCAQDLRNLIRQHAYTPQVGLRGLIPACACGWVEPTSLQHSVAGAREAYDAHHDLATFKGRDL
jgi:hypothetical protein